MQGAVDRSDIYRDVEKTLDALIAKNLGQVVKAGREIRRAEIGEKAAAEEEARGRRIDDEYAENIAVKREERMRIHKKEEARKRKEETIEKLKAEETKKREELERLRSADEKRKEREARKAEREAEMEKRRQREREYQEQLKKEREKAEGKEPDAAPAVPQIDDNEALEALLRESQEIAAKSAVPKADNEGLEARPIPKGPAADRVKQTVKPRLGYSSAPIHQDAPIPPRPREPSHSGSPYHAPSRQDRSPSASRGHQRSHSISYDEYRREADSEAKIAYKAQIQSRRELEADSYRRRSYRGEEEHRSRSRSRGTQREPARARDRSKDYEYDYDQDRLRQRYDERPKSRDRERSRYEEPPPPRQRREEAPEGIDRYVPGGPAPRRDRERREAKEGDSTPRDAERVHKERDSSYYDVERDRRYYKKETEGSRSEYRDKDSHRDRDRERDRDRDRDHRHRDRDRYEERSYRRPRTDEPPEHIDRYVPGGGSSRDRDRERDRDRDRERGRDRS